MRRGRPTSLDSHALEIAFVRHSQGETWAKIAETTFDQKGRQVSPGTLRFKAWERRRSELRV